MQMRVDRWDVRRDGPFAEAALIHKVRALGYDAVTRPYPAGAMIWPQPFPRPRIQGVVSGLIKITIDSEAAILSAGDLVFVPADAAPRVEILGPTGATCVESVLPAGDHP